MTGCNITLNQTESGSCHSYIWPRSTMITIENLDTSKEGKIKIVSGKSIAEVLNVGSLLKLEKKYGGNTIIFTNIGVTKIKIITN